MKPQEGQVSEAPKPSKVVVGCFRGIFAGGTFSAFYGVSVVAKYLTRWMINGGSTNLSNDTFPNLVQASIITYGAKKAWSYINPALTQAQLWTRAAMTTMTMAIGWELYQASYREWQFNYPDLGAAAAGAILAGVAGALLSSVEGGTYDPFK